MSPESEALQRAAAAFIRDRHRFGAFVGGLIRDAHAAEDVIQEVWLRLAAELEKGTVFDNQAAWCRGVAKNLILKHWRKQRTAKVLADSEVLEVFLARVDQAFAESDESAELWERRQQALDECVAALPEKSRRLLSLRYEGREALRNDWFIEAALPQSLAAAAVAVRVPRPSLAERFRAWIALPQAEEPALATLQLWSRASFAALAFGLVTAAWLVWPSRGTMESDSDPAFIAQLMIQNQLSDEP